MGSQLRKLRAKAGVTGREHQAELRRRARTREVTIATGGQPGLAEYSFKVEEPARVVFAPQDIELSIGGVPFPGLIEPVIVTSSVPMSSPTMPEQRPPAPRPLDRRSPLQTLLLLGMMAGLATGGGRRDGY